MRLSILFTLISYLISFQNIFTDFRIIIKKIIGIIMIKINIKDVKINEVLKSNGIAKGNGKI